MTRAKSCRFSRDALLCLEPNSSMPMTTISPIKISVSITVASAVNLGRTTMRVRITHAGIPDQ